MLPTGVALLLTVIGAYGVPSYAVSQRRREIGFRMSIGASPKQVMSQFLNLGAKLLFAGIVLDVLSALITGRAMESFLFGISSVHFGILATTGAVMGALVLLATFVPSYRASRVSPTEALRQD